jgi:hypothetical protein
MHPLDTLDTFPALEKVIALSYLRAEFVRQLLLCEIAVPYQVHAVDDEVLPAISAPGLTYPAEPDIVPEIASEASIFLPDSTRRESLADVVLDYVNLLGAVDQIHRVDQFQVLGEVLADRQARAWISFVRDQVWLYSNGAESGCAGDAATDRAAHTACQIRQHLIARDLILLSAKLIHRVAG